MGKAYEKSAKDKAFERERIKLSSTIQKKNDQIAQLTKELEQNKTLIASLNETIKILEDKIGIPKEEIIADMERNKRLLGILSIFERI